MHMTEGNIARKVKKLINKPDEFFADSPHSALQRFGALLKRGAPTVASYVSRAASPTSAHANDGQGASTSSASSQAQHQDRRIENARSAEYADDARKLAGFAVALAATDYPFASEGVVMGQPSYRSIGLEFLRYFIKWGELSPEDDVLDVGCGGGRMAAAIGYYLSPSASYVGFDVHRGSINWCLDNISTRWPNFRFDHYAIGNSRYNPRGALKAESFAFPYADATFSFAIATSLFTHLTRQEVRQYLAEIARVLRHGGRLFSTAFLMTPAAEAAARHGTPTIKFEHQFGENPVQSLEQPMAAVAQHESVFFADVTEAGLVIDRIAYGWWSGLRTSNGMQDIIVLRKP